MRILLVSSCFGTYGGIEAFTLAVARHVAATEGFEVRVVWKRAKGFQLGTTLRAMSDEAGVTWSVVERGSWSLGRAIRWADVVHAQNAPPDVLMWARMVRKPVVLTIHNYLQSGRGHSWLWPWLARWVQARWFNSQFVWDTWEKGRRRSGSLRVPTVSNLPTVQVPMEQRIGFVFAARWIENKGADILVAAYERAGLDPDRWPVRMLGDGPLRGGLLEQMRARGIRGIEMPGFVTEEEKHQAMASARWMVVPPHTNEDMGLTAIEARSVGVPVIATRDGGLPEAAGPGALLCEPGSVDDLTRVLQEAAAMPEETYRERAKLAQSSLEGYLVPLTFYTEQYRAVCGVCD